MNLTMLSKIAKHKRTHIAFTPFFESSKSSKTKLYLLEVFTGEETRTGHWEEHEEASEAGTIPNPE